MQFIRKFFKELWTTTQKNGDILGYVFLILGVLALIPQLIFIITGSEISSEILGIMLGLFSVGLGFIAINMAAKSDKRYTTLLNRIDKNLLNLLQSYDQNRDTIEQPAGNIIVTPKSAKISTETHAPEIIIDNKSKEAAQKRLDEDTKKVGFIRGEVYQLEDGSWGIAWGGKYPL